MIETSSEEVSLSKLLSTAKNWQDIERIFNASVQLKRMNLEIDLKDEETHRARIKKVEEYHRGGTGTKAINGGVLAYICDLMVGLSTVRSGIPMVEGSGVVRVNMRIHKALYGNKVEAEGNIDRVVKNLVYANVKIYDEKRQLCVSATGTVFCK